MRQHDSSEGTQGLISIRMSRGVFGALIVLIGIAAAGVILGIGLWFGKKPAPVQTASTQLAAAPVVDQASAASAPATGPSAQGAAPSVPNTQIQPKAQRPVSDDVPVGDNPRLALPDLLESNYVVNFGDTLVADGPTTENVRLTNPGVKPLVITDVSTNCSCTSVAVDPRTIEPGQEAVLEIIHDPEVMLSHQSSVIDHEVTIASNDPAAPKVMVGLRGVVVQ